MTQVECSVTADKRSLKDNFVYLFHTANIETSYLAFSLRL